ncbi:MAG: endonuclease III, partial [Haloplanus sp.]
MSDEPAENVSGGADGGGVEARFATGDPETRAEAVVDALGDIYWRKAYGGRDAFPCLVRTILSQNTSDVASQPAFDALLDRYDGDGDLAATLANADRETLADTIASAGLYNQKSRVIVEAAREIVAE